MEKQAQTFFSPKNGMYHYLHEDRLAHLDDCLNGLQTTEPDWSILDDLFRRMVCAAWRQA